MFLAPNRIMYLVKTEEWSVLLPWSLDYNIFRLKDLGEITIVFAGEIGT
jgi:hypothetical protein